MENRPPKWADRFLAWYCNPDLLEEIQGDAYELYLERRRMEGRRMANLKYWWDIVRFLRASNVKRAANDYRPGYFSLFWNLDFRIAVRNAFKNKFTFTVKSVGLAVCLAFTLTLAAFVFQELNFDKFHPGYRSIYRIGSEVELNGVTTRYAVSPFQMGPALAAELPEVSAYCRLLHVAKPVFKVEDVVFSHALTIQADSNFLRFFGFRLVNGSEAALDEPNRIVLTQSTAKLFFGDEDPMGRIINFNEIPLEVAAVIDDELKSHLRFDVIISWATFRHNDSWDNINAYTYLKLHPEITIEEAAPAIEGLSKEYLQEMITEYGARYEPIIQNVADIHLGDYLDEDIAAKRKASNVYILLVVIIFFLMIGLVNYHNIVLAELSTQLRRFGILRVFGGVNAVPSKAVITDAVLTLAVVVPLTMLFVGVCTTLAQSWLSVGTDVGVFKSPPFIIVLVGFLTVMLISTRLNAWVIAETDMARSPGASVVPTSTRSLSVRKYFLAAQLCFSVIMLGLISVVIDQFRFINEHDKGIEHSNTIVLALPDHDFSKANVLMDELRKIAGISGAEASSYFPAGQIETRAVFEIESDEGMKQRLVQYLHCDPGFFSMMKVRVVDGEVFNTGVAGGPRKFLVNEAALREFGWTQPAGKRITSHDDEVEGVVAGVVRDFHLGTLHEPIEPLIIFPANKDWGVPFVYVKTAVMHSPDMISRIEQTHAKVYPDEPFELNYLDARYANLYQEDHQVQKVLIAGLAISILVTCLGIFGMSALMMILRTREMGIRKVVGANRPQLFYLHMKVFLRVVLISLLIGSPLIYYLSSYWLNTFAYHISAGPFHLIAPGLAILMIVLVTAGWHANKNSLINPADVLKQEN